MPVPQNSTKTPDTEWELLVRELHEHWERDLHGFVAVTGAFLVVWGLWRSLSYLERLQRPQCIVRWPRSKFAALFDDMSPKECSKDSVCCCNGRRMLCDIQYSFRALVWTLPLGWMHENHIRLPVPVTHKSHWITNRRIRKYARMIRSTVRAPLKIFVTLIKNGARCTSLVLSTLESATICILACVAWPLAWYVLDMRADRMESDWRIRIDNGFMSLRYNLEIATKRARLFYYCNEQQPTRRRLMAQHAAHLVATTAATKAGSLAGLLGVRGPRTYTDASQQCQSPLFATLPPELRIVIYKHVIDDDLATRTGLRYNNHHFLATPLTLTCKALYNELRPIQHRVIEKSPNHRITWQIPDISPPCLLRLLNILQTHHEDLLEDFYTGRSLWSDGQCRSLVRIRGMGVELCLTRKAMELLMGLWTPKPRVAGSLRNQDRVLWASQLQEPAIEVESGAWHLMRELGWKRKMWREAKRKMRELADTPMGSRIEGGACSVWGALQSLARKM